MASDDASAHSSDLRRQDGPHVFVTDLDVPELDEADHHHLARSLRLRDGDPMTVSDGAGRWRTAAFGHAPEPTGPIVEIPTPSSALSIAFALTKAGKPEMVVQKATEIGIDRVLIFRGARSVPRWSPAKATKAHDRLARVAREAAMQSRQVRIPEIGIVADLAAVHELVAGDGGSEALVRADFASADCEVQPAHRCIAIGAEGGWSPEERSLVPACVDLGPTVLRAETAALVAASKLTTVRHMRREA